MTGSDGRSYRPQSDLRVSRPPPASGAAAQGDPDDRPRSPRHYNDPATPQVVNDLRAKMDMSVIWITHDLGVVAGLADRVIVMYGGRAVELAEAEDLFYNPQHPYSVGLLNSVPSIADPVVDRLLAIDGLPPDLSKKQEGCAFHPRCPLATDQCRTMTPVLESRSSGGLATCFASPEDVAALAKQGADNRTDAKEG